MNVNFESGRVTQFQSWIVRLMFKKLPIMLIGASIIALISCDENESGNPPVIIERLKGYIQKGPYINGTTFTISELNSDLSQTGLSFSTVTSDNSGSFEINNLTLNSFFIELRADGFYYNEVDGVVSSAPLTLWGVSDITERTSVNVNLLTHLERDRVKYLIEEGATFAEAKNQAAQEVLAIFGFTAGTLSFESLDISADGDDNAKLLAISAIIQGERSVGEVSELLANIIVDIKEDGILDNEAIKQDLQGQAKALNLSQIRQNIEDRYEQLGLSVNVADFETYVNEYAEESVYGTLTDIDGNEYRTKKIGGQWWMVDNLKTTQYSNGDPLINGTDLRDFEGDDSTKYYFTSPYPPPSKDEVPGYGYFYTMAAVLNEAQVTNAAPSGVQGVCPTDWHVPSFAEYQILMDYMATQGFDPGYANLDMPDNAVRFNLVKTGWR